MRRERLTQRSFLVVHQSHGLQSVVLITLLQHALKDFVEAERRHYEVCSRYDRFGEKVGIGSVSKVFQPTRRIDDIHRRSVSRSMVVSIPLRKPLIFLIDRTGMSSIRFS